MSADPHDHQIMSADSHNHHPCLLTTVTLVLGMFQHLHMRCFSPNEGLHGDPIALQQESVQSSATCGGGRDDRAPNTMRAQLTIHMKSRLRQKYHQIIWLYTTS